MKRVLFVMATVLAVGWAAPARASDPTGVYVLVDKVVFEPSEGDPQRIQIWGTMALVTEKRGYNYSAPMPGYLYYSIPADKAEACRREWADFKRVAGTGQVVGFGSSYDLQAVGRVRKATAKAETPDVYPVAMGLVRFRGDTPYTPVRNLFDFAAPVSPADGAMVPAGKVTLVARNVAAKEHAKATYVFEFEVVGGDKEVSPSVPAGEKETRWTPKTEVKPGQKYMWRVRAVDGSWKGPMATASIQGKDKP